MGNEIWSKKENYFYILFFSKIAPRWGQIVQSYLALGRAKLKKSSKVEFIGANSDFGGVEMISVPPVWLLGSIWLFSFYSVPPSQGKM